MVCSVQCSVCGMKCTGTGAGFYAGAGAVCSAHCAECSVLPALPATGQDLEGETG